MGACYEHLGYVERLAIADERRRGLSIRAIARMLKRSPSTVSREIKRIGPYWQGYNPAQALFRALARRRESRQGACKLIPGSPLFAHVAGALCEGWSPSQIAGRLRCMDPAARPGTFFANRAAEQAEAKKIADATKSDLLATIAERDRNAPGSADYIRLNASVQSLQAIVNEPNRREGLYGSTSVARIAATAFTGAAGANVTGSIGALVQAAAVNVLQSLAVTQVKKIADGLLDRNGNPTAGSEAVRVAFQYRNSIHFLMKTLA